MIIFTRTESNTKKEQSDLLTEHIITNKPDFSNEMELINRLPYAITVHDNFDKIIYENSRATELFGLRTDDSCQARWCHHTDYVRNVCPLCPGKFTKKDTKAHKVFRKLIDSNLQVRYLEFETVPVINTSNESDGFIEIVRDVTEGELIKVKNLNVNIGERKEERILTLVKHGNFGSEVVFTDKIYFVDNTDQFLIKLGGFAFIGIVQNDADRKGLFGPIPVLDNHTHEMFVFSFHLIDKSIKDPRKHQQELLLFLIIFERNDKILTLNRQLIHDLLESYTLKLTTVEDLTNEWFNLVNIELNKLIDS